MPLGKATGDRGWRATNGAGLMAIAGRAHDLKFSGFENELFISFVVNKIFCSNSNGLAQALNNARMLRRTKKSKLASLIWPAAQNMAFRYLFSLRPLAIRHQSPYSRRYLSRRLRFSKLDTDKNYY